MQIFNKTVQALTQFSGNSGSELTNINEKACNNIPEAVNKLDLSAGLGHSFKTGWNKHDHSYIIQNKIKPLSQDEILALLSTSLW